MVDLKEVQHYYESLDCCWRHPANFKWEDVDFVEAWEKSVPDEEAGYALCSMKYAAWAVLTESQDYSGHG